MAFSVKESGSDELPENHEINVTPFIDVMLVLLIIFMVAAPLATVSIPVDLPSAQAKPQQPPADPLYLTIQSDLTLTLGDDETVSRDDLPAALKRRLGDDENQRIFLRGDKTVSYGDMMEVMTLLSSHGYFKIALVGLESIAK